MATIVLLHGGGAGGWMWRDVKPRLLAAGHSVLTPTFTGIGDRSHLLGRDVTHAVHVQDVANLVEYEEADNCVLVGFSYGGSVIPGVAAAQPARVTRAIFLDALVPRADERLAEAMGYMSPVQAAAIEAQLRVGEGPLGSGAVEIVRAEAAEHPHLISPESEAWMLRKITDMPMRCMVDPVRVGAESLSIPVDYVAVPERTPMHSMHTRARELDWPIEFLGPDCDHAFPFGKPELVATLLLSRIG